jgi:hypothetical protein
VVVDGVRLSFVEGEDDQSTVVVEVGVVEQSAEPEIGPIAQEVDGGVMAIVDHIGREERPLGYGRGVDIGGKVVEVTMIRARRVSFAAIES